VLDGYLGYESITPVPTEAPPDGARNQRKYPPESTRQMASECTCGAVITDRPLAAQNSTRGEAPVEYSEQLSAKTSVLCCAQFA